MSMSSRAGLRRRLPGLLISILSSAALALAYVSSTSCEFLMVSDAATRDMTPIGIFCSFMNEYKPSEDLMWKVSRISIVCALVLGFIAVAASWVLVVFDFQSGTKGTYYRYLGFVCALSCAANIVAFLLFDSAPCRDADSVCAIKMGCFLLICSSVLYLFTAIITECWTSVDEVDDDRMLNSSKKVRNGNNPADKWYWTEVEEKGDQQQNDDDDFRRLTIDTELMDRVEKGSNMSDITEDLFFRDELTISSSEAKHHLLARPSTAKSLSPRHYKNTSYDLSNIHHHKSNVNKARVYPDNYHHVNSNLKSSSPKSPIIMSLPALNENHETSTPRSLPFSPEAVDTMYRDDNEELKKVKNDIEDDQLLTPAQEYGEKVNKHRRQWMQHPPDLLPRNNTFLSNLKPRNREAYISVGDDDPVDDSNYDCGTQTSRLHSSFEQYNELPPATNPTHAVKRRPSSSPHLLAADRSANSEKVLLHLLNEKRILDESIATSLLSSEIGYDDTPEEDTNVGIRNRGRSRQVSSRFQSRSAPNSPGGVGDNDSSKVSDFNYSKAYGGKMKKTNKSIGRNANSNNNDKLFGERFGTSTVSSSSTALTYSFDESMLIEDNGLHDYIIDRRMNRYKNVRSIPLNGKSTDSNLNHRRVGRDSNRKYYSLREGGAGLSPTPKKVAQKLPMLYQHNREAPIIPVDHNLLNRGSTYSYSTGVVDNGSHHVSLLNVNQHDNESAVALTTSDANLTQSRQQTNTPKSSPVLYLGEEARVAAIMKLGAGGYIMDPSEASVVTRATSEVSDSKTQRSRSVPPVLRMRNLRQAVIKDRFSRNVVSYAGEEASSSAPNSPRSPNSQQQHHYHFRDNTISELDREAAAQRKFDWEESRRQSSNTSNNRNQSFDDSTIMTDFYTDMPNTGYYNNMVQRRSRRIVTP